MIYVTPSLYEELEKAIKQHVKAIGKERAEQSLIKFSNDLINKCINFHNVTIDIQSNSRRIIP